MELRRVALQFRTAVGPITEAKLRIAREALAPSFGVGLLPGPGHGVLLSEQPDLDAMVLEEQMIMLQRDAEHVEAPDFERWGSHLRTITDRLALEQSAPVTFHYVGVLASEPGSMAQSLKSLNATPDFVGNGLPPLEGVGLRFLARREADIWEFKLEPFLRDPRYYYLEGICGVGKALALGDVVSGASLSFNMFRSFAIMCKETYGI